MLYFRKCERAAQLNWQRANGIGSQGSTKLLYLQNGPRRESVSKLEDRFAADGFDVDVRWAYNGQFPDTIDDYAACFLSGSPYGAYEDIPWINREHELIRDLAEAGVPTLGICFGSQILGSALCGRDQVFRRSNCEVGFFHLDVHAEAKLRSLPRIMGTIQAWLR